MIRALVIADLHLPYASDKLVRNAIYFAKQNKCFEILCLGDIMDCYSISKFDTSPARADDFVYELEATKEVLNTLNKLKPNRFIFVQGNHEMRLPKLFMRGKNRGLYNLDQLKIYNLLDFDKFNIKYVEHMYRINNNLIAIHGSKCGLDPAKAEAMSHMCSGISGHTHKESVFHRQFLDKKISWYSLPCMCDIDSQGYAKDFSHAWNNGFGILTYDKNRFKMEIINSNKKGDLCL